jgi:hypothetical protein
MIVGSLLGLLGFLLAITMGMASDRFDTRRGVVLAEANAIGTTWLRAGYLPEPASAQSRMLLLEYAKLRIVTNDVETAHLRIEQSAKLQTELWPIAESLAREVPQSVVLGMYISSLNEVIDLHEERVMAGLHARVPVTIFILLLSGIFLVLAMVGFNAGLMLRRSSLTAAALIVVLAAVVTLIFDLDRPGGGLLRVSQQPLLDLLQQIDAPMPGEPR